MFRPNISVTALAALFVFLPPVAEQLSAVSYFIDNVGNGRRVLTGSSKGAVIAQQGFPVTSAPVY